MKSTDCSLQKYGPFVRISPNHVSVAHKDAITVVYGQGSGAFDKSAYYHAFVSDKASLFSTTDRKDHSQKRKLVSQAFSYRSLQQVAPFLHANINLFVEKLDDLCRTNEYFDALQWFNYLAFDILSDLAFGEAIGMVSRVRLHFILKLRIYLCTGVRYRLCRKIRWDHHPRKCYRACG